MIRLEVSVMFIAFTIEQRIDGFQVEKHAFRELLSNIPYRIKPKSEASVYNIYNGSY